MTDSLIVSSVHFDTCRLELVLLWNDFRSRERSSFGLGQIKIPGFCVFPGRLFRQISSAHFSGKLIQQHLDLTAPSKKKNKDICTMIASQ